VVFRRKPEKGGTVRAPELYVATDYRLVPTSEVPHFLETANKDMTPEGEVETLTYDIEGCFPNMPKEAIKLAMKYIAKQERARACGCHSQQTPTEAVCLWENPTRSHRSGTRLPWGILLDVLEFAADNAYVRMPCGTVLQYGKRTASRWVTRSHLG
jgi:hypothetical protein